ncbi:MAG: acyl-CoA thioesterase [Acidimicrobiia bacterium]
MAQSRLDGDTPLTTILDIERLDRDLFRAQSPHYTGRRNIFGGQVASQSLMAAAMTVPPEHRPHSFHLYFMRSGAIGEPIVFYVSRIRDGRSFTTRNVIAQQGGEAILTMSASFHKHEPGDVNYQSAIAPVAPPDVAVPTQDWAIHDHDRRGYAPLEVIHMGGDAPDATGTYRSAHRVWMRCADKLPDDPLFHACALAYMSDTQTGSGPVVASGRGFDAFMMTSLDHALHFHRHVRADEWLLVDFEPMSVTNGRGMTRATIHSHDGVLGATVQQELLMRELREGARSHQPGPPERL